MPEHPLRRALMGLLPKGCAAGWADPLIEHDAWAGEDLPQAVPSRRREFAAGRVAARHALADLGYPPAIIPVGPDRAPQWPQGILGSISHTRTACLAAVGHQTDLGGLGIDLEEDTPLRAEDWDTILLPIEQGWLRRKSQADRGYLAKVAFSAKEAAYKAQYPISRTLFGFEVMTVELSDGQFSARFQHSIGPFPEGFRISGRFARTDGHILTVAHF